MKKNLMLSQIIPLLFVVISVLGTCNKLQAQDEQMLKSAVAETEINLTDYEILESLYNSTDGANWKINTNWLSSEPISTWYGITVESEQITEIKLKDNNLKGNIPADLGQLISLQYLDLDTNNLSGSIPVELGQLTNLEFLYLDGNQLTGTIPIELGQLTNLLLLYLNDNKLTGPIPAELGGFPDIKWVNLSMNQLSGTIPVELAQLPLIEFLNLSQNLLTSTIPSDFGQLSTLRWLNLSGNLLTGTIPTELGQLSTIDLEQLYLNDNQLTGNIPVEFGNLKGLKWLNLGQNQLSGSIPVELGQLKDSLSLLYLNDNLLEGAIPVDLGQLKGLEWLNLGHNQLTGNIPSEIWQMTNLKLLYLNGNQLTGAIPNEINLLTELIYVDFDSNQFNELPDLSALVNLTDLTISNNNFTFEDLEYNMDLTSEIVFTYAPQDSIGEKQEFIKNEGESFTYILTTGGTQNSYKWFKDGEELGAQTSATLEIVNLQMTDAGVYHCEVTNATVDGLILVSHPISLLMNGQVEITFNSGWNIFSSLVMPDDKDMLAVLQPLITGGKLKKVMDESGKIIEDWGVQNGGWQNTIGDIKNTEGYKINVTESTSLSLTGVPTQLSLDIHLNEGWNIISWPSTTEQDGLDVFADLITVGQLKKVMNESGKFIEDWGADNGDWQNTIGNFMPGEGYKVNVNGDCVLTVNQSGIKSSVLMSEIVASTHFVPSYVGNGIDHMNINLVNILESGIIMGDEIGVFDGSICVGSAKVAIQNPEFISLIASADDGAGKINGFKVNNEIQLKLFRNGKEYPLTVTTLDGSLNHFEKNGTIFATVGTDLNTGISMPENEVRFACYPNPFHEVINIEINLQNRQELEVEIYDLLSRRIAQLYDGSAEGMIQLQWDANDSQGNRVAPGVYVCRVNGLWGKVILN